MCKKLIKILYNKKYNTSKLKTEKVYKIHKINQ